MLQEATGVTTSVAFSISKWFVIWNFLLFPLLNFLFPFLDAGGPPSPTSNPRPWQVLFISLPFRSPGWLCRFKKLNPNIAFTSWFWQCQKLYVYEHVHTTVETADVWEYAGFCCCCLMLTWFEISRSVYWTLITNRQLINILPSCFFYSSHSYFQEYIKGKFYTHNFIVHGSVYIPHW